MIRQAEKARMMTRMVIFWKSKDLFSKNEVGALACFMPLSTMFWGGKPIKGVSTIAMAIGQFRIVKQMARRAHVADKQLQKDSWLWPFGIL